MATTNFYLDKKQAENPTYIIFSLSDQGKRYRVSTGEKILPQYWNDRKQIVKRTYTGCVELNAYLEKFSEAGLSILREAKTNEQTLSAKEFKDRLKAIFFT